MISRAPILSICIPTFNQPIAIEQLLERLVFQYNHEIEIIICDDSDSEKTHEIIIKFQKLIPIKYFHRNKKGGLDSAIIFLTEEATGDFVWWIGDDIIFPDSINKILNLIKNNLDICFIWLNSVDIFDSSKLTIPDTQSKFFIDKNDVISIDIGLLGFITATVFRRKNAIQCLPKAKLHIGTAFVCMYIILYVISSGCRCYYLGTPCFSSYPKKPGEIRWYNQIQVFGINIFIIINEFKSEFDIKSSKKAISKNLKMVLKAIVVERGMGLNTGFASNQPVIIPLFKIYWNYVDFYLFLPLLFMPNKVLIMLYFLFKYIRSLCFKKLHF